MDKYESYLNLFTKYIIDNYDINNELINMKYLHTIRVSSLMLEIGEKLYLSDDDLLIAFLIGLFHDLGRFREVVRQQRFNNLKFDHGAYSNKILYNDHLINEFDIDRDLDLIIRKALYFHNKKDVTGNLTEKELFFSRLIRDADKIDILNLLSVGKPLTFNAIPTDNVLSSYLEKREIDLKYLRNRSDRVVLYLGFANNLYFMESKKILKEHGYLERLINNVKVLDEYQNIFEIVINDLNNEEGEKKYVR